MIEYIIFVGIILGALALPPYLASLNKKDKIDIVVVRCSSWLFGWTGVGWLVAVWWAVKK